MKSNTNSDCAFDRIFGCANTKRLAAFGGVKVPFCWFAR
jgi:hypothetical protein